MSHWYMDEEGEAYPQLHRRLKVNRMRYQQVKEALRLKRYYRANADIAEDFGVSKSTLSRIKKAKTYNKYLRSGKNENNLQHHKNKDA